MENGSIFVVLVVAILFGRRSIVLGFSLGVVCAVILYFWFFDFQVKQFCVSMLTGSFMSLVCSILSKILFSGLKGGNENYSPSYLGMSSRSGSGMKGGIIYTDEDEKNARLNQRKIR